jgi:Bacterial Ig domain
MALVITVALVTPAQASATATQAPATAVTIPSAGATVAGTAQVLDATASSAAGISSVTFEVSGRPSNLSDQLIGTARPTLYGCILIWNTTTVPNGTYTLQSVATDTVAETTPNAAISITVDNPPPSTTAVIPQNGATLDSAQGYVLDAVASPGVTHVSIEAVVGGDAFPLTATPTIYGWIVVIPAPQPCNRGHLPRLPCNLGSDLIQSVASYSGGVTGTSPPVQNVTLVQYELVG